MSRRRLILLPKFFLPATGGLQIATARIGTSLAKRGWLVSIHFPSESTQHQTPTSTAPHFETFAFQGARREFWDRIPFLLNQDMRDATVLAVGLEYEESLDAQINALRMFCQAGALTFLRVATTSNIASRITTTRASRLAQLDGIVVLNREMEKEAGQWNFRRDFVHRIPVMVDTDRYRPDALIRARVRESRGIPQNLPVVLYAGRLDPRKRIELVIEAMVGVDALLWIVGDPTMGPNIEETECYARFARACGLRAVKIESGLPEVEVPALLQAADVFVTGSRVEGLSNAVLEASSVGLAVVGFAIPGIEEIAQAFNGAGFYLAHPESGGVGLRSAIQAALGERSLSGWRSARKVSLMDFSVQKVGACWHSLLGGPS